MSPGPKKSARETSSKGDAQSSARRQAEDTSAIASASGGHRTRGSGGGSAGSRRTGLLDSRELASLESQYGDGITAVEIVELFTSRGVKFSEATFRKYVQQGLLPRSRRIGRKGKHRGSLGVYPPRTVRRVNAIKLLMQDGHTIEEIQERFLRYTDIIESLEEGVSQIFQRFEQDVSNPRFDTKAKRSLERDLVEARKSADDLLRRVDAISKRVSGPRDDTYRSSGAAGSAEDLL